MTTKQLPTVTIYNDDDDKTPGVFIDTTGIPEEGTRPMIRVFVNNACIFDPTAENPADIDEALITAALEEACRQGFATGLVVDDTPARDALRLRLARGPR